MLTHSFEIRKTAKKDCSHIGPLMRSVWLATYSDILTPEELIAQSLKVHQPEQILAELSNPAICTYVADVDGQIVGHARGDLVDQNAVYVARLYLEPKFHKMGIGKALLHTVEGSFATAEEVKLDVYEDNKSALDFYLSQGYKIAERATEIQSEGKDVFEYKMTKSLE